MTGSDRQMVHPITCQVFSLKRLPFFKRFHTTTSQMVPCSKPSGVSFQFSITNLYTPITSHTRKIAEE